ncbi:MAG: dephospho-CoA kinase [Myxococcales bacterium]|nr:dephospho-CoA kinase [Myxococcales bacterium]
MHLFGLTGGIATGKSTVSRMFSELGVAIIDADLVAREVVEPGQPALAEIAGRFPGVVDAQGRLDRPKLAARIFQDPQERAALNAITHPRIQAAVLEKTRLLAEAGAPRVLYDAALLIENGLHRGMHGVVLVVAPPEVQRARLMARDRLSQKDAEARIASQMPLDEKRAHATWIVDNGGPLEDTHRQVRAVFEAMQTLPPDA